MATKEQALKRLDELIEKASADSDEPIAVAAEGTCDVPADAPKPKRKPRSKEERAAELLADAARDKAVKTARDHMDVIKRKLRERDFVGAFRMTGMLCEQISAELMTEAERADFLRTKGER